MIIVDLKTTSALTYDLVKGYMMDGQLLTNAIVYKMSDEEKTFGPLAGVIVKIAAKHKDPQPGKSFECIQDVLDEKMLSSFYRDLLVPAAYGLYDALWHLRGNRDQWKQTGYGISCASKFMCPYFNLCAMGEEVSMDEFVKDERLIITLDDLVKPDASWKQEKKQGEEKKLAALPDSAPEKEAIAEKRLKISAKKNEGTAALYTLITSWCRLDPQLQSSKFLVEGHTEKSVKAALAIAAAGAHAEGMEVVCPLVGFDGPRDREVKFTIGKRGVAWATPTGKAQISWKAIADAIVDGPDGVKWWDLSRLEQPVSGGSIPSPTAVPPVLPGLPPPPAPPSVGG